MQNYYKLSTESAMEFLFIGDFTSNVYLFTEKISTFEGKYQFFKPNFYKTWSNNIRNHSAELDLLIASHQRDQLELMLDSSVHQECSLHADVLRHNHTVASAPPPWSRVYPCRRTEINDGILLPSGLYTLDAPLNSAAPTDRP